MTDVRPGSRRIVVEYDVETPLRDGTILRSTVYRPDAADPHPALLTRTPYGRDLAVASAYFNPTTVAAAGFAVVAQDVRGRFGSDGDFEPSVNEADDGEDTIAWLAAQPWCDGTVGMWGRSYFSETQWRAALRRPPALKATATGFSAGGNADNGAVIRGGAIEFGSRFGWGHASAVLAQIARRHAGDQAGLAASLDAYDEEDRRQRSGELLRVLPLAALADEVDPWIAERIVPSFGATPGDASSRLWDEPTAGGPFDLATLHIGGWYDIFLVTTLQQYRAQLDAARAGRCPRPRLVIGPWTHIDQTGRHPDRSFGMAAGAASVGGYGDLSSLHARWFGDVLRDRDPDEGSLAGVPAVLLFVMGEDAWRGYDELPDFGWQRVLLGPGLTLIADEDAAAASGGGAESFVSDPADPVPTVGGSTMMASGFPAGAADQRGIEARDDVLCFTSGPLREPLETIGGVRAHLALEAEAPDVDVVVRVTRVTPDGASITLCDGITRASWRDSYAGDGLFEPGHERRLVEPGEPFTVDVTLWATACVFAPGDRLRVHVAGSSFPRWDRNPQTGGTTYDSADVRAARVTVRTGGESWIEFQAPEGLRG